MGNETLKSAVLERTAPLNLVEHLASPVLPFQARSSGHFRETTPNLSGRVCFVSRLAITCGASPPKMMEHEEIPIGLYLPSGMGSISKYNRAIFWQHATTEGRFMYSNKRGVLGVYQCLKKNHKGGDSNIYLKNKQS